MPPSSIDASRPKVCTSYEAWRASTPKTIGKLEAIIMPTAPPNMTPNEPRTNGQSLQLQHEYISRERR